MISRTRTYSITATGPLPWIAWRSPAPTEKSVMVNKTGAGTVTWKLEHTLSNLQDGTTPVVVDDDDLDSETGDALFSSTAALTGTRVNVTARDGVVDLTVTFLG